MPRISGFRTQPCTPHSPLFTLHSPLKYPANHTFNTGTNMATEPFWTTDAKVAAYLPDLTNTALLDILIPQAITESEDRIAVNLREGYNTSSSDQGLKTGATLLAAAASCRAAAAMALAGGSPWACQVARMWMDLASVHESNAAKILHRFTALGEFTAAAKQAGGTWNWE